MRSIKIFLFALIYACVSCANSPANNPEEVVDINPSGTIKLKIQKMADGLRSPVAAAFFDDGKGAVLICEQLGVIRLFSNGKLNPLPFLDIREKMIRVNGGYDERGLLGIALHPNFNSNRKFYVYYSSPSSNDERDHKSTISEFKASTNLKQADINSERVILTIEEPESNHNGGDMHFGNDGYLYISVGDGGGAGDVHGRMGNGQNLNVLLGKILRIDINKGKTYSVPVDNPFVGKQAKPEIWAYGLRNPWRFSFDRKTKELFAGDVGQNSYEEIDIIKKGGNYGWRIMEGKHCYDSENCKTAALILPINEYGRSTGISVTGGFVYNGKSIPSMIGKYLFADWSGPMFFLEKSANAWTRGTISITNKPDDLRVLSFAEDNFGELYMLTNTETGPKSTSGAIYKLVKP